MSKHIVTRGLGHSNVLAHALVMHFHAHLEAGK